MSRAQIHEIRIGLIVVRIVARSGKRGARHMLTAVRLYRDGEEWKRSTRFSAADAPVLRLALDQAYLWILQQQELVRLSQDDSTKSPQRGR